MSPSPPRSQASASASFGASSPGTWPYTALKEDWADAKSPASSAERPATQTARHSQGSSINISLTICSTTSRRRSSSAAWACASRTSAVATGASRSFSRRFPGSSTETLLSQAYSGSLVSARNAGSSFHSSASVVIAGASNRTDAADVREVPGVLAATTSRSTPSSCTRNSSTEANLSAGSAAQAFDNSRYKESWVANSGVSSTGRRLATYVVW